MAPLKLDTRTRKLRNSLKVSFIKNIYIHTHIKPQMKSGASSHTVAFINRSPCRADGTLRTAGAEPGRGLAWVGMGGGARV